MADQRRAAAMAATGGVALKRMTLLFGTPPDIP
jgi:hypothetical protein